MRSITEISNKKSYSVNKYVKFIFVKPSAQKYIFYKPRCKIPFLVFLFLELSCLFLRYTADVTTSKKSV